MVLAQVQGFYEITVYLLRMDGSIKGIHVYVGNKSKGTERELGDFNSSIWLSWGFLQARCTGDVV